MRKAHKLCLLLSIAAAASCSRNSVTVEYSGGKTRITACSSNILRVTSVTGHTDFIDGESLMSVRQSDPSVRLKVTRTDSIIIVKAPGISAEIRKSDGAVRFYGADGRLLTSENRKSFSPITADGHSAWTVRQTFFSPDDEAFFGLGQHQADEWNYKGRNEELYQYNTKISLPFIVSSRRYGLLWDSNSFCRWGDARGYASLGEVFTLHDKYGEEGALTGTYTAADGTRLIRRETSLDQEFLETPKCDHVRNAPQFKFNGSNVLFEGEIEAPESGLYRFRLYYAGYIKVFIGGEQVMPEIWRTAWNPNGRKFEVRMEKGIRVPVRIEWKPDGDVSYCGLRALSPLPEEEQKQMSWWGEMQEQIDYYIIAGETIDNVISGYRLLTGKAPIMPRWAMGYWQSRERYSSQQDITGTLAQMRSLGIPVDNIVQDWQYWEPDQWGSHEFDRQRYPDPEGMIDTLHGMGGRFMISVWPKFYTGTDNFKALDSHGWIYRRAVTDSVADWLGYQQSFYDAYDPGARKMFWEQMKEHLFRLGVDAWWMDASEPNIHDCTDMDYRKALCGPTALGSSTEYFNAYSLMNAMAIYDGQREAAPDQRVFLLTRNGFPGLQRYSTASWSGDIGTRWEDMKAQISAGLNYSISGIPFWGQDIGGFSVENRYMAAQSLYDRTGIENEDMKEWRELQARWHEWGIFCPIYRSHGQWPYREPYNIAPQDHPAYKAIVSADRLRYALLPYIYTMAARVHFEDYTIMRPLVMDFTDDVKARGTSDEFMFGDALMICPVYEYKVRSREVYLPDGQWYEWHSGAPVEGGMTFTAEAPFERIPVYVRAGQIIPVGPDIQYTAQDDGAALTLRIYAGQDASYSLYEDDGLTYAYERGEYSWIPVCWDDASSTLTISARKGSCSGMNKKKTVKVEVIRPEGCTEAALTYTGKKISVQIRP